MPTKASFSFPKKEKLKSKKLIDQLFSEGQSLTSFPLKLIYLEMDEMAYPKVKAGVTVPKKKFKKAVQRNHIKRLLREAYRHNKHLVFNNSKGNFAFLFLYLGKEMPIYAELDKSMQAILHKFLKTNEDAKID